MSFDTIFALATGRPPAAIAIIRISGPRAHDAGRSIAGELPPAREAALREFRHPEDGSLLDQGLCLRFDAPASATGEDVVELHAHGGRAVVDAVLDALAHNDDLREARPGEFTRRAFENGRIDLTEAEGLADLLEAETETQRRAALEIAGGALKRTIEAWQGRLLDLSGQAEAAIDYVDEDTVGPVATLSSECGSLAIELSEWLDRPRIEPLKEGVRVVIAGPPNSGKSSLLNVIAGDDRAIVTDVPGTTRDHIEAPLSLAGIPILLTDTAGLRDADDSIEQIGVARTGRLIEVADVLLWLGERALAPSHPHLIAIHSRCDLRGREEVPAGSLAVSSLTGKGIPELLERIGGAARSLLPAEGALALNRRQAAHIGEASDALDRASASRDVVLIAEGLRSARTAFDRLTGKAGVEDVLEALFSQFCLGK